MLEPTIITHRKCSHKNQVRSYPPAQLTFSLANSVHFGPAIFAGFVFLEREFADFQQNMSLRFMKITPNFMRTESKIGGLGNDSILKS